MSSATLTDTTPQRGKRARTRERTTPPPPVPAGLPTESAGLSPGHFFLLATASLVTVAVVVMRGQSAAAIVLAALTVAATGFTGYMVYRTLRPLTGVPGNDEAAMLGGRTRAALERDKFLVLRAIKELEFDHAMGKVADADFTEMRDRLRARAIRLLKQLDGAAAYRTQIERDLAARLPETADEATAGGRTCAACGTVNESDARFCKMCGTGVA